MDALPMLTHLTDMIGKGHCRFDIAKDESEYADFYDFVGSEAESGEEGDGDDTPKPRNGKIESLPLQPDENSARLPSGRIISNRSQPQPNTRRRPLRPRSRGEPELLEGEPISKQDPQAAASSTSLVTRSAKGGLGLTRAERQENTFTKQLATLSANDQKSLAHLSLPEQRAVLATQQKQVEKARRAEERYRGRVEGLGNQFLMTHFVKDAADKRTLWK
jgi:pre-60S factor REI1